MPISNAEWEGCKGFVAYYFDNVMGSQIRIPAENHPIAVLDKLSSLSMTKARQGLEMAINDCLEHSADLSVVQARDLDAGLASANLPTLSAMRRRFWRRIRSALKRGRIRGEVEYYAVRNAAETSEEDDDGRRLWALVEEFEARVPARRRCG